MKKSKFLKSKIMPNACVEACFAAFPGAFPPHWEAVGMLWVNHRCIAQRVRCDANAF